MDFGRMAAEYRQSAERIKQREEQLLTRARPGKREDRLRLQDRILLLRTEYWQLLEVAGHLERFEREGRATL